LENNPLSREEGPLKITSAQLSTIETQLIPIRKASISSTPLLYRRTGASTIENSCSTVKHNWSTIEATHLELHVQNEREEGGWDDPFHPLIFYCSPFQIIKKQFNGD